MTLPVPVNPKNIVFKFPTRTCGFNPASLAPQVYSLSQATTLPGVAIANQTFSESCLALFSPITSTTTPTNNSTLQSLIKQFSTDFLMWKQTQFDTVLAGVAAVIPNGLIQVMEISYNQNDCFTRISTLPDNFPFDNLVHQLTNLDSLCPDTQELNTSEPCSKVYGPPILSQSGNTTSFDEFLLCFEDGRLTEQYLQTVVYNCGCGQGVCCGLNCSPCTIPQKNLTVTINGLTTSDPCCVFPADCFDTPFSATVTLIYNGNNAWDSGCFPMASVFDNFGGWSTVGAPPYNEYNYGRFILACNAGQIQLGFGILSPGNVPTCAGISVPVSYTCNIGFSIPLFPITSHVCNPFSLSMGIASCFGVVGSFGATCNDLTPFGPVTWPGLMLTGVSIVDSNPVSNLMCQLFNVVGCNGLPYPNLTVTVAEINGSYLTSGVTNSSGQIFLFWPGPGPSIYKVTVTGQEPRNIAFSENIFLACNGTTRISLPADTGYACSDCCPQGIKTTLILTDSVYGTFTLTYVAGLEGGWVVIAEDLDFDGCKYCNPAPFDLNYNWNCNLAVQAEVASDGPQIYCPGNGGTIDVCNFTVGDLTCPTGGDDFSWSWSGEAGQIHSCQVGGAPGQGIDLVMWCEVPSFTVTEA